jgi:hypothetical protein
MKWACGSTVRDPENRSRKRCVCGGHSRKARKRRRSWCRADLSEAPSNDSPR